MQMEHFTKLFYICVSLASLAQAVHARSTSKSALFPRQSSDDDTFDWSKIKPSSKLQWTPCGDNLVCARLEVPLDYSKPESPARATIALTKYLAKANTTDGKFQPSILYNPGGPGGSGTSIIQYKGEDLQELAGKQYSIIGFDPRGVGQTTPVFNCFPGNDASRQEYLQTVEEQYLDPADSQSFRNHYLYGKGFAQQCAFYGIDNANGTGIAEHMGTPVVATDLLSIAQAEYMERGLKSQDAKVWFWGVSYGTALGSTFATMFPDKIGRMILDGVVDTDAYYNNDQMQASLDQLVDLEHVVEFLYQSCATARDACELWSDKKYNTSSAIRHRVQSLIDKLDREPAILITDYASVDFPNKPMIITGAHVRLLMFKYMYNPVTKFALLARMLSLIEAGEYRMFLAQMPEGAICTADSIGPDGQGPKSTNGDEGGMAVECGDSKVPPRWTLNEFGNATLKLGQVSPTAGYIWASWSAVCNGWNITQSMPFPHEHVGAKHTSHPILFMSTQFDPVCPLASAMLMTSRFPTSSLVIVEGGHGHSTTSAPSVCAVKAFQLYLKSGKVPRGGQRCPVSKAPFSASQERSATHHEKFIMKGKLPEYETLLAAVGRVGENAGSGKVYSFEIASYR